MGRTIQSVQRLGGRLATSARVVTAETAPVRERRDGQVVLARTGTDPWCEFLKWWLLRWPKGNRGPAATSRDGREEVIGCRPGIRPRGQLSIPDTNSVMSKEVRLCPSVYVLDRAS